MTDEMSVVQDSGDDMHQELDSMVLEAIENIVSTSRRMRSVQKRRSDRKKYRHIKREDTGEDLSDLNAEQESGDDAVLAINEEANYHGFDEDTCQLPSLSVRQRDCAVHFAQWLMQQDNYPIILQHIEELLATMDEEIQDLEQSCGGPDGEQTEIDGVISGSTGTESRALANPHAGVDDEPTSVSEKIADQQGSEQFTIRTHEQRLSENVRSIRGSKTGDGAHNQATLDRSDISQNQAE